MIDRCELPLSVLDKIVAMQCIVEAGSGYKSLDEIFIDGYEAICFLLDNCTYLENEPEYVQKRIKELQEEKRKKFSQQASLCGQLINPILDVFDSTNS